MAATYGTIGGSFDFVGSDENEKKQEDWGKHLVLPAGTADAINQVGDYTDVILYKSVPAYGEQENKDGQNTKTYSFEVPEGIQEL
ncbi:hypothetical protein WISP_79349 [Willisornis vidua]|uniref:Uncharacterized protein n=1 Tax=Willisornis vidua TaxID=1566151 RepID=A0ABQ9DA58_9PASS|nr:hypothetical protein WISP_79349 [Willisornis vidua]